MKEDLFDPIPGIKLYRESAVRVGTFLGGPIIAGYLLAENYKVLGEPGKMRTTWAYSILATVLIYGAVFLIPEIEKIPNYIIPLVYSVIASLIFQKYQGNQLKNHIEKGGQLYTIWRAVLIGLIGLLATAVIIFVLLYLTNRGIFQQQ